MADYNIPRMPKHYGTLKMPEHDVERELTLLRQNWKDLPISAVVSEYGYACHAQRLADTEVCGSRLEATVETPCEMPTEAARAMEAADTKRRVSGEGQ